MISLLDSNGFAAFTVVVYFVVAILVIIIGKAINPITVDYLSDLAASIISIGIVIVVGTPLIALAHFVFGIAGSILAVITTLVPLIMIEINVANRFGKFGGTHPKSHIAMIAVAPIASIAWAVWIVLSLEQPAVYTLDPDLDWLVSDPIMSCMAIAFLAGSVTTALVSLTDNIPDRVRYTIWSSYIAHIAFIGIGLYYGAASIFTVIQHVGMGNATISDFALIALPLFSLALYTIRVVATTYICRHMTSQSPLA